MVTLYIFELLNMYDFVLVFFHSFIFVANIYLFRLGFDEYIKKVQVPTAGLFYTDTFNRVTLLRKSQKEKFKVSAKSLR